MYTGLGCVPNCANNIRYWFYSLFKITLHIGNLNEYPPIVSQLGMDIIPKM